MDFALGMIAGLLLAGVVLLVIGVREVRTRRRLREQHERATDRSGEDWLPGRGQFDQIRYWRH